MSGINVPYLPTALWTISTAFIIVVMLVTFFLYWHFKRREGAVTEGVDDFAQLQAKEQLLRADVERLTQWMKDQKEEIIRLQAEREEQEKIRAVLSDLEQQCAAKENENRALRNEVGELENQRHYLGQTLNQLKTSIGDFEKKEIEVEALERRLSDLKTKHQEATESVKKLAELEIKIDCLSKEKIAFEQKNEDLKTSSESLKCQKERFEVEMVTAKETLENKKNDLKNAQQERSRVGIDIDELGFKKVNLEGRLIELEHEKKDLDLIISEAESAYNKLSGEIEKIKNECMQGNIELTELQKERKRCEIELNEISVEKSVLEQTIKNLNDKVSGKPEASDDLFDNYSDLLSKEPACLNKKAFDAPTRDADESIVLNQLHQNLKNEGLIFNRRIIDAFHTALKCHDINPLTVLAGVSGTGKTLLPMRYADLMGMHSLVMAVQPRWDSPQDMFGFYNYLEKEYKATDLSRSLIRMDQYNYQSRDFAMLKSGWTRDRVLMVLLDEMNLARIEYYFSDFLSKLEFRREVKDASDAYQRSKAEIELDSGPGHRFNIWVNKNILFVGTMNEDETTQTLSDKVLDRANVIRFGKPDEKANSRTDNTNNHGNEKLYMTADQWEGWHKKVSDKDTWYDLVMHKITELNASMDRIGRPFGFRVQQAIMQYISNYPQMLQDNDRYKLALSDQLEQKIIPKLRGVDINSKQANGFFGDLERLISTLNDKDLENAFETARSESYETGMFHWRGVNREYVEEGMI